MSTDFTALAVAAVGVAGTMGAPWLSQRAHRADTQAQAEREERAREAARNDRLFEEKRSLYVALNSTARAYRSALRDCVLAVWHEGPTEASYTELEQARTNYREQFARAQMVLPQRPFQVVVRVNEHLGYGLKITLGLLVGADSRQAADDVLEWTRGPLLDAITLLNLALREDLAVIARVPDLEARLDALPLRPRNHDSGRPVETPPDAPLAPRPQLSAEQSLPVARAQQPDATADAEQPE